MKNRNDLGIYIHIPFCIRKCNYCDFLSFGADESVHREYTEALLREIDFFVRENDRRLGECVVSTVFFGGGTPSAVDEGLIVRIMDKLRTCFELVPEAEITIECNPGTLTKAKALAYRQAGINRISFGLQSTDDELLKLMGRIHTYDEFCDSYKIARQAGFDNISVDLMAGLPGQTVDGYLDGVRKVLSLGVEHLSSYGLIVEENTPLHDNINDYPALPSEEDERLMYELTGKELVKNGLTRYEISNYAAAGRECRHNIRYWERGEYLGFGLGASGLYEGVRTRNISDMAAYMATAGVKSVIAEQESVGEKDAMEEFMFLGLRMIQGVSAGKFKECFGVGIEEVYYEALSKNINLGLLECEHTGQDTWYRLTEKGLDVSNMVMVDFLFD